MTQKQMYIDKLTTTMRSAGQDNWAYNDIQDICELAGIFNEWLNVTTRNEGENIALKAAKILGVEIRHYVPIEEK